MVEPKRTINDAKPQKFLSLGNGNYFYNYNIKEVEVEEEDEVKTKYSYIAVPIYGYPTYKQCVKNLIREYLSQDEEFDLINSYNTKKMQGETDTAYLEYLNLLQEIKTNVKHDFK